MMGSVPFGRVANVLVASLLLLLAAPTGWAVDDPYQTFVTTNSTNFRAVMLRQLDRFYVIATRQGVQTVRRSSILVPGQMTQDAAEIDHILSLIERHIRSGNYHRVEGEMSELRERVDRFERQLQNDLESSAKPMAHKDTLRYAIEYYHQEVRIIKPTLRMLDLIDQVQSAHSKNQQNLLLYDLDTLSRLIELRKNMNAVDVETPMVANEREEAEEKLTNLLQQTTDSLRSETIAQMNESRQLDSLAVLMAKLQEGAGEASVFAAQAELLLEAALGLAEQVQEEMLAELADGLVLRNQQCQIDDADYLGQRQTLQRQVLPGLESLRPHLFGPNEDTELAVLEERVSELRASLEQASERRDVMNQVQAEYQQAEAHYDSRSYALAARTYEGSLPLLDRAGASDERLRTRIVNQALRSQAEYILAELRTPETDRVDELETIMNRATDFLDSKGEALAELGYSLEEFRAEVQALELYRLYRTRFLYLEERLLEEPMKSWQRVLMLNDWLTANEGTILPQANRHWSEFLEQQEDAIFNRARDVFFEENTGLNDQENQETFYSFVAKFIDNQEYDRALNAIDKALASQAADSPFSNSLLTLQLQVSERFAQEGELIRAVELYQDVIDNYPNFAARHNVPSALARVKQAVAEGLVAEGKLQAAVDLYEEISTTYRTYAQKHNILTRLLELKLNQLGYEQGADLTPEMMAVFDRYSELFPGYLANLPELRGLKRHLTESYEERWQAGEPRQVVDDFLAMNEQYPSLSQELQLPRQVLVVARNQLAKLNQQLEDDSRGGPATVRSDALEAAGELLHVEATRDLSQRPVTEKIYISLLLRRADEFFQVGQIARGYKIYNEILEQYPQVAEEQDVEQIMADRAWDLKMERVRRPLGIRSGLDWGFLFLGLLVWGGFFTYARRRGQAQGDLKYRMQHFLNAFGVFLLFMVVLLVFNVRHSHAFLIAFLLPGTLFTALGCATFLFFPLVYWERRLLLEKGLLWLTEEGPLSKVTGGEGPQTLKADVARLETMVSLMNDRRRFEIHVAIKTSEKDAKKGQQWLLRILARLEQENRQDDAVWREHHALVLRQLGQLAQRRGETAEARRYLESYIEHEPKDLEVREQLGELTYEAGDYEEAIPHLKVLLAAHSQDDSLWYRLGRAFFETDKHVAAYKCFDTAKKKDRDIYFYGARSYARANELERAVKWYQGLLKAYGQDTEAVYYFASTLAEMGDSAKALKVASVIQPDDAFYPSALALQGNILFKKNELEKAGKHFHKSLELSPQFIPALIGFGQVMIAAGKLDSSAKYFQRIVEQDAAHPAGNYFLGVLQQEKGQYSQAVAHLQKAVEEPRFRRWAARRIGYLSYFADDLDTAVTYLSMAEEAGETSPWILFLLAYSLARKKDLRRCEQVLIKILGRSTGKGDWTAETATRAMYTIGTTLFQEHAYKMAHQCFDYVRENPIINTDTSTVAAFIEESRFRMVVNWLQRGEYIEAQARCSELQLEAQEQKRFESCQYYLALCQLYQGQYQEASKLLGALVQKSPEVARYHYHQIVAELGSGNEEQARQAMNAFAGMSNRPAHLAAGLVTIQAYLNARRGKVQDAERSLARVSLPDGDSPGDTYLREKIILARIFYLCHLQDYDTIATLMQDLSEEKRSYALYLQAVSSLQAGDYPRARDFLKPFADRSERDRQLFTFISAQLAIDDLRQHLERDAKAYLEEIPKPPREIKSLLVAWEVSDRLAQAGTLDELNQLIELLEERRGQMQDEYFNYFILHNLAVLYLKRAYVAEDSDIAHDERLAAWQNAIAFWFDRVIESGEYWNMGQSRFQEPGQAVRPFTSNELESIAQTAKDQYFINVFVGYILSYLSTGDEVSMDRHLQLLGEVAEREGKLKSYFRRLGEKVERYLRSIPKSNELWNSWDFTVASLDLQVRIADVLGLDNSSATEQLELFRETRQRYASPVDYQQAKRQFNTLLLETIQVGVRGSFSEAGEMLDKCLRDIPPGVDLGKVHDSLKLLREACRNPAAYAERGVNLSQQFEKAYATVRTINIFKGKDGNAKRS